MTGSSLPQQLSDQERAELELLRDLRRRVIGFGGDDYAVMPWIDAHRHHADEPYVGCPFCRDQFVPLALLSEAREIIDECWELEMPQDLRQRLDDFHTAALATTGKEKSRGTGDPVTEQTHSARLRAYLRSSKARDRMEVVLDLTEETDTVWAEDELIRDLDALSREQSAQPEQLSDDERAELEVLRDVRHRLEAEVERLRAAIDAALSTTWVKDDDDAWGTDEDVVHPDRLTALAALQPHWQAWGDQAWDIAGRAEDRLRRAAAEGGGER